MEVQGRTTTERLIDSAIQAGALSAAVKLYPESRQGLERAYTWHHTRTAILADEIAKAGPGKVSSVRMTTTPKR